MGAGWFNVDRGSARFTKGEFLADVADGKAPRFQGASKGLLWLEEELGLSTSLASAQAKVEKVRADSERFLSHSLREEMVELHHPGLPLQALPCPTSHSN